MRVREWIGEVKWQKGIWIKKMSKKVERKGNPLTLQVAVIRERLVRRIQAANAHLRL